MEYDSLLDQQSISGKNVSLILCVWKPDYMKSGHIYCHIYMVICLIESLETWSVHEATIILQTFCGLRVLAKEI